MVFVLSRQADGIDMIHCPERQLGGAFSAGRIDFDFKGEWCPGADLNHRHADFQSAALPLSYPGVPQKHQEPAVYRVL